MNTSDRNRAWIKHTGKTSFGDWVWTKEEDDLIRQLHPDFAKMEELLGRRKLYNIKRRANRLGMVRTQRQWTTTEVTKLKRRWRDASKQELLAEFPRHPWSSIAHKAVRLGIHRARRPPKRTGKPILDEIRNRAAYLRISLRELDRICFARYFFNNSSRGADPDRNVLLRAITALGGKVEIVWR